MKKQKFFIGDKITLTYGTITYDVTTVLDVYWGDNALNRSFVDYNDPNGDFYYVYMIPELVGDEPVVSSDSGYCFKMNLIERTLIKTSKQYVKKVIL